MTIETGNNDVRDNLIIDTAELHLTLAADGRVGGAMQHPQPSLRDNECSQQQLVRLVGYRGPITASEASWDRLRRQQAALKVS